MQENVNNSRQWSHKYWKSNNAKSIIDEIINKDDVSVKYLSKKETLNPLLWKTDESLFDDVRRAMLENAIAFIKFCKIESIKYTDVIMTGSLANYNWTEYSDIDIHILLDFKQIADDSELVADIFKTKKALWESKIDSTIKGFDVELYIQDTNESHISTGIYSILKTKWIKKPIKSLVSIDLANVQLKSADLMNQIDDLLETDNQVNALDKIIQLWDKIKKYRQIGLDKDGEYSTENLVFKVLRNNGYLTKVVNEKDKLMTKQLTLDEINTHLNEEDRIIPNQPIRHNKSIGLMSMLINTLGVDYLKSMGVNNNLINKSLPYLKTIKSEQ